MLNVSFEHSFNIISFLIMSGGPHITLAKFFSTMHFKGVLTISLATILFCSFLVDY